MPVKHVKNTRNDGLLDLMCWSVVESELETGILSALAPVPTFFNDYKTQMSDSERQICALYAKLQCCPQLPNDRV